MMQIVSDSGVDFFMPAEEFAGLKVHIVPLTVTLDENSYREGLDIEKGKFYQLLSETDSLPTTSQPSAGEFADTYHRLAANDPEILSIHMSSGLSGTYNAALAGSKLVREANVTVIDTKTLSAAAGWQVEAAARAVQAGKTLDEILTLLGQISVASDSLFTLKELKYLIHGGRISHMKGLIASMLNIKPLIGVEKVKGTYEQQGQVRTFKAAVRGLVDLIAKQHKPGSKLRIQVAHSANPEGAELLQEEVGKRFDCESLPYGPMSLVLGAHTGPSMIGIAYAPQALLDGSM